MPYPFWKVFLILHRLSVEMDVADELNRFQKSPLCKAMGQLASGYRDGWDVPKDLDLATKWFERAADFTVEAMYQSYLMYSKEHCWRWSSGGVFSTSDWIRNILCWLVKGIGELMCVEFQTHLKIFHVQRYPPGHISATGQPDTCQSLPGASCSDGPWRIHEEIRGATGESQTLGGLGMTGCLGVTCF